MRPTLTVSALASVMAMALLHCASRDVPIGTIDDDGRTDDAMAPEADVDASTDAGVSDAATEDEYEIPDGSVLCDASPCVVALTGSNTNGGGVTFCALLDDKTVECWGSNLQKKLGYDPDGGALPMASSPHRLPSIEGVTSLSAGGDNACARQEDGSVFCWGASNLLNVGSDRDAGQLPRAGALPTRMDLLPPSLTVAVGLNTACVESEAGALSCWGSSDSAQLAHPTSKAFSPPAEIPLGGRVVAFAGPGQRWMFAGTTTGELLSWGSGNCVGSNTCRFMLGRETSEDPDPVPAVVTSLSKVRAVASANMHACAIAGRYVQCWGDNQRGQLGRGTIGKFSELAAPTILSGVTDADDVDAGVSGAPDIPLQIAGDETKTCAVMGSGRVYCWGALGDQYEWGHPRRMDGLSGPAVALVVAGPTSCALLRSGGVECWGSNMLGALGRGSDDLLFADPKPAPVLFQE